MRTLIFCWVCLAGAVCGCNSSPPSDESTFSRKIGSGCVVQFRRDALGAAASLPVSPRTGEINGASVTVAGELVRVTNTWVVIRTGDHEFFIPKESILMLEFGL